MTNVTDFDETYSTHAAAVYRVCLRAVSRPDIAESMTSDVFLLLHRDRHILSSEELPAWLFTAARHRAADFWRLHFVDRGWPDNSLNEQPRAGDPHYSLDHLLAHCDTLKQVHRVCLVLRFRHGMPRAEIATQTGLSELQVKGHLQYALQLLRKFVDGAPARTAGQNTSSYV